MKTPTTIILPGCDLGGTAKTTSLVMTSDYLKARGYKLALYDCDLSKQADVSSFANWVGGKVNQLDLRDAADCDRLLTEASNSGVPYVVVDLPADSGTDICDWLNEVCTAENLKGLGLRLIAIGCISNSPGSTDSVQRWVDMLGDRASWMITLSRMQYERKVKPLNTVFSDWFDWLKASGQAFPMVEIPHMHEHTKKELLRVGKLPSQAIGDIDPVMGYRVQTWIKRIHPQLEATGLFNE